MSTNEFAAFETLDLAPIKMKLMHVASGEGWSTVRANAVETEYRRFLFLMKKYPDAEASPTVDVDTFWHYHILDTQKYARDCEALFGYFLHHYPYVGIGAGANEADHAAGGERMRAIYEAEFGAQPTAHAVSAFCTSPGTPRQAANDAYAFCTSPGMPREASAAYAFCTSPGTPRQAVNMAYAFCTSPGAPRKAAVTAFCTSPGKPLEAASAAYAFCTSPGQPRQTANEAYAFCTSPGRPRAAANAAYAFCTSPGKPLPEQASAIEICAAQAKELSHAA